MTPEEQDRLNILVGRINTEQDQDKFTALVQELNDILEAKEERLKGNTPERTVS